MFIIVNVYSIFYNVIIQTYIDVYCNVLQSLQSTRIDTAGIHRLWII